MIKYRVIAGRMDYRTGRIKEIFHDKTFDYRYKAVEFKDKIFYMHEDFKPIYADTDSIKGYYSEDFYSEKFFCYVKEVYQHEAAEIKTSESATKGDRRLQKVKGSRQN